MATPDLTQKVIGFRQWSIKEDKLFPVGGISSDAWKPGPQKAYCAKTLHGSIVVPNPCIPAVNPYCECGYYALHTLNEAHWHGDSMRGIVLGWGRMAIHNPGWRAEWVELAAVIYPQNYDEMQKEQVDKISKAYNVPVVEWDHAEEYAKEFGDYCPESLKPKRWNKKDQVAHDAGEVMFQEAQQNIQRIAQNLGNFDELREDKAAIMKAHKMVEEACLMLDPEVPEAYAALHNIYVPNVGELLQGLNEGIVVDYIPGPDPIVPAEIEVDRGFELSISTNATVLWLPLQAPVRHR